MEENKIDKEEIIKAIEDSGYLIEQRVEAKMASHGYYVEVSDAYKDSDTGKTREIDITAISALHTSAENFIFPYIIAECENNKQPVVFFKANSVVGFMYHEEVKLSGFPLYIYKNPDEFEKITSHYEFQDFHHYCKGVYSTQYCSFQLIEKRGMKRWIALHPDEQHNTFQSLIKCLQYKIDEHFSYFSKPESADRDYTNIQLYYPLLILQGDLYEAVVQKGELKLNPRKHIQYRKQIAKGVKTTTFQIDVITEDYLDAYIKIVSKEAKIFVDKINKDRAKVEKSMRVAVDKIRKAPNEEEMRKIVISG